MSISRTEKTRRQRISQSLKRYYKKEKTRKQRISRGLKRYWRLVHKLKKIEDTTIKKARILLRTDMFKKKLYKEKLELIGFFKTHEDIKKADIEWEDLQTLEEIEEDYLYFYFSTFDEIEEVIIST